MENTVEMRRASCLDRQFPEQKTVYGFAQEKTKSQNLKAQAA